MRFLKNWFGGKVRRSPAQRAKLRVEALESRDLLSASPLPVLLVLADQRDFYYKEYADTRQSLEAGGLDVVVAASTTQATMPHWNSGQGFDSSGAVVPDIALADADASDYSAIVFVGGWGSSMYQYAYNDPNGDGVIDNYYADNHYNGDATKIVVNDLINDFVDQDKYVTAICHGVTVLAWARVDGVSPLAGKQVAAPLTVGTPTQFYNGAWSVYPAFSGQYDQVVANGGLATAVSGGRGDPTTVADDVVIDGRIITAENFDSALHFGTVIAQEILASSAPPVPDVLVQGTASDDTIYLWSGATPNQVFAWVNGEQLGPFVVPDGGRIVVRGGDGNDRIYATDLQVGAELHGEGGHDQLTGGTANDIIHGGDGWDRVWSGLGDDLVFGGAGNDCLHGREGNDVLVGGAGDDWLEGFDGRDLLIGGLGGDQVRGGDGDDVLIGGTTNRDDDAAALAALMAVWLSADPVQSRIGEIANVLTVADDATEDTFVGAAGADWFLAALSDAAYPKAEDVLTVV